MAFENETPKTPGNNFRIEYQNIISSTSRVTKIINAPIGMILLLLLFLLLLFLLLLLVLLFLLLLFYLNVHMWHPQTLSTIMPKQITEIRASGPWNVWSGVCAAAWRIDAIRVMNNVVWAVQGSRLDVCQSLFLQWWWLGWQNESCRKGKGGGPLFAVGAVQQHHKCHRILCMKNSHYANFDFLVYWCNVKSKEFQSQCKCKRVHQWPCLQILLDVLGKPSCSRFGRNGSKHCFSFTTCCFI